MPVAFIGLGANLGDAESTVTSALHALAELGCVLTASSLYRTKAWGVRAQPDFINAAARLDTPLDPYGLLSALQGLERRLGRVPSYRWGPRAIDLDILAYEGVSLAQERLTLPHPRLLERAFVLAPLAEIDPAYRTAYEALPPEARAEVERLGLDPKGL